MTTPLAGAAVRAAGARRAVACALAAVLLSGCAQSVDPIERMGRKAAQKVRHHPRTGTGTAAGAPAPGAHRRWGLAAPLAPAPPAHRVLPPRAPGAVPPVVDHVPTREKVVFLTYDDTYRDTYDHGAGDDARFVDMVRDLRLPISMFLTHPVGAPGHDHFGRLRALGAGIENRTLTHPFLPGLGYVEQHAEICGQQDHLKARFGTAPRLLRPPHGTYDADTLRAAGACGIDAIVLGRASTQNDALRPGDIILTGFRKETSPTETTARTLRRIQEQGFTVGRLEDYL
ncbi:polysaccharide deacetylase family protein [Streptomyces sp. NPDC102467]|uniref:polysaccharide deacetylase family protein n=1 Tax=Streptomyces sp. NPDC102467 TaxID=3366179 RepID=UPI00382F43CB